MNNQSFKLSVVFLISIIFIAIAYLFMQIRPQKEQIIRNEINLSVPFKTICENFRNTSYSDPKELFEAFSLLNSNLDSTKNESANINQDKEDLFVSLTDHFYPMVESICVSSEYNWSQIKPCIDLTNILKKNSSYLNSNSKELLVKYSSSLQLFGKFEKLKKEKLDNIAMNYDESIHTIYSETIKSIQSDEYLSKNSNVTSEINDWKVLFDTWREFDKFLETNEFKADAKHYELNEKYRKLNALCSRMEIEDVLKMYSYYRSEVCGRKEILKQHLDSLVYKTILN